MRDGLQGRSYLEELDCLGTVLLVKTRGGGGLREFSMVDGLVEAEKRKVQVSQLEFWRQGALGREYNQWRQTRYFQRY